MKHFLPLLLASIFLCSCAHKASKTETNTASTEVIKVDFNKELKREPDFPYTKSAVHVRKLEDNPYSPIGHVDKVIVNGDNIYILDRSKAKAVFIYGREKDFLGILNYIGRGPGEFIAPDCFDIDKKTGNIVLMDCNGQKMIVYSPLGEYINEFKYDFIAVDFVLDHEGNPILNTGCFPSKENDNLLLVKMDMNGQILERFFQSNALSPTFAAFSPRNSLQRGDDGIYLLPTFSNQIYALNNNGSQIAYSIDFGEAWPTEAFFEKSEGMHPLKVREQLLDNGSVGFLNCIQTKDLLHLDFHKGKDYSFYYNKNTKQSLLFPKEDEAVSHPVGVLDGQFIFAGYKKDREPWLLFYDVDVDL